MEAGRIDSYERLAIAGYAAYSYVDILDEELKTGIKTDRLSAELYEKMEFGLKPTAVSKPRVSDVSTSSDGDEGWGAQSQATVYDPKDLHPARDLSKSLDLKSTTVGALSQEVPHQLEFRTVQ